MNLEELKKNLPPSLARHYGYDKEEKQKEEQQEQEEHIQQEQQEQEDLNSEEPEKISEENTTDVKDEKPIQSEETEKHEQQEKSELYALQIQQMQSEIKKRDEIIERFLAIQEEKKTANKEKSEDLQKEEDFLLEEMGERSASLLLNTSKQVKELSQKIERNFEETKKRNFAMCVSKDIPEIQGLLSENKDFQTFLENKRDFSGRTALDFVASVPANMDVNDIPKVRALIDEFKKSQENPKQKRKTSAPPKESNKAADSGKLPRKATLNEEKKIRQLIMAGKTKELNQYFDELQKKGVVR